MGLKRVFSFYFKNPIELYEQHQQKKLSKDEYMFVISLAVASSYFIHGFYLIQSILFLLDPNYIQSVQIYIHSFVQKENSILHIISLLLMGECVGTFFVSPFIDGLGRKKCLLLSSLATFVIIAISLFLKSGNSLMTCRVFLGVALGCTLSTSSIYLAEIVPHFERGMRLTYLIVQSSLGGLICLLCKYFIPYRFWKLSLIFPLATLISQLSIVYFIPESPHWLLANKTPTECSQSLRHFRRHHEISREFNTLYKSLSTDARLGDTLSEILNSSSIKWRIFVILILFTFGSFLSFPILFFPIYEFFYQFQSMLLLQETLMALLTISLLGSVIFSWIRASFIDRYGRKPILMFITISMIALWSILGILVNFYYPISIVSSNLISPIFTQFILFAYFFLFMLLILLSWIYLSHILVLYNLEIFPYRARSKLCSLLTVFFYLSQLISLYYWQYHHISSQKQWLYFIKITLLSLIFLLGFEWMFLPETTGYLLEELEDIFKLEQSSYFCFTCSFPIYFWNFLYSNHPFLSHNNQHIFHHYHGISKLIATPHSNGPIHMITNTPFQSNYSNAGVNSGKIDQDPPKYILEMTNTHNIPTLIEEEENFTFYEPTSLHKYSHEMKETKFHYEDDELDDFEQGGLISYQTGGDLPDFVSGSEKIKPFMREKPSDLPATNLWFSPNKARDQSSTNQPTSLFMLSSNKKKPMQTIPNRPPLPPPSFMFTSPIAHSINFTNQSPSTIGTISTPAIPENPPTPQRILSSNEITSLIPSGTTLHEFDSPSIVSSSYEDD